MTRVQPSSVMFEGIGGDCPSSAEYSYQAESAVLGPSLAYSAAVRVAACALQSSKDSRMAAARETTAHRSLTERPWGITPPATTVHGQSKRSVMTRVRPPSVVFEGIGGDCPGSAEDTDYAESAVPQPSQAYAVAVRVAACALQAAQTPTTFRFAAPKESVSQRSASEACEDNTKDRCQVDKNNNNNNRDDDHGLTTNLVSSHSATWGYGSDMGSPGLGRRPRFPVPPPAHIIPTPLAKKAQDRVEPTTWDHPPQFGPSTMVTESAAFSAKPSITCHQQESLSVLNSLDCWDYTIELECLNGVDGNWIIIMSF